MSKAKGGFSLFGSKPKVDPKNVENPKEGKKGKLDIDFNDPAFLHPEPKAEGRVEPKKTSEAHAGGADPKDLVEKFKSNPREGKLESDGVEKEVKGKWNPIVDNVQQKTESKKIEAVAGEPTAKETGPKFGEQEKFLAVFPAEQVNVADASVYLRNVGQYMHHDAKTGGWEMREVWAPIWGDCSNKPWMAPVTIANEVVGIRKCMENAKFAAGQAGVELSVTGAHWQEVGSKKTVTMVLNGQTYKEVPSVRNALAEVYWSQGAVEMFNKLDATKGGIRYSDSQQGDGRSDLHNQLRGYELAESVLKDFEFDSLAADDPKRQRTKQEVKLIIENCETLKARRDAFYR